MLCSGVTTQGWIEAVADSAANLLPRDQKAASGWTGSPDQWQSGIVDPLLSRVHQRFHIASDPDTAVRGRIGRILAYRAAEVRWGQEAAEDLLIRYDPDLRIAMRYWDKIDQLLAGGP